MLKTTGLFLFLLAAFTSLAQPVIKQLPAVKTTVAPKIDGVLDDEAWKDKPIATDFVEYQPTAGRHETKEHRT